MYYLIVINILSFILYGYDKRLSIKNKFRISENNLLLTGLLGGCLGSVLGMKFFHHKTKKTKFIILNTIFIILWIIILIEIYK